MTVDGKEVVAGADDIVVIGPETPHRFTAIGDERLDMVCIHASDRLILRMARRRTIARPADLQDPLRTMLVPSSRCHISPNPAARCWWSEFCKTAGQEPETQ